MSVLITVVGIIGLTTLIEVVRWVVHWTGNQAFLRLTFQGPVDVVLSPARSAEVATRADDDRYALRMGNLRAASAVARAVGAVSSRKQVRVHISDAVGGDLTEDLVLVGASADNPLFTSFLRHLNRANPGLGLTFDERIEHRNALGLQGERWRYNWQREAADRRLDRDFGLIVVWDNPFAREERRGILCAGFTATGNAALVDHVLGTLASRRRLADVIRTPRFAQVVEMRFVQGRLDEVVPQCEPVTLRPRETAA